MDRRKVRTAGGVQGGHLVHDSPRARLLGGKHELLPPRVFLEASFSLRLPYDFFIRVEIKQAGGNESYVERPPSEHCNAGAGKRFI